MVRALLVLCCSEIEMQILLSRPTSEFSHSLGQIRPSCSIAVYGSSSSDSCRSSRMPATAESGQELTSTGVPTGIERQKRLVRYCRGYLRPSACVVPLNWPVGARAEN